MECAYSIFGVKRQIMFEHLKKDIATAMAKDPAARSKFEVFWTYHGIRALMAYRLAHKLFLKGHYFLARVISQRSKRKTGIEIHPGATIGEGLFIDHGTGVVIGETTEIGNNVTIYQGVTLGGTGKDVGKRHPTIQDNVMISAGAKILGPVVIGEGSKVGAGSVVLKDVPSHCTVVGVPGRVVKRDDILLDEVDEMDQIGLPDPVADEFKRLYRKMRSMKLEMETMKAKMDEMMWQ